MEGILCGGNFVEGILCGGNVCRGNTLWRTYFVKGIFVEGILCGGNFVDGILWMEYFLE